jgi:hypothetical protein
MKRSVFLKVNHFYAVDEACIIRRIEALKYCPSSFEARHEAIYTSIELKSNIFQ